MDDRIHFLLICHKRSTKMLPVDVDIRNMTHSRMKATLIVSWEEPADLLGVLDNVREFAKHARPGYIEILMSGTDLSPPDLLFLATLIALIEKLGASYKVVNHPDMNDQIVAKHYLEGICS